MHNLHSPTAFLTALKSSRVLNVAAVPFKLSHSLMAPAKVVAVVCAYSLPLNSRKWLHSGARVEAGAGAEIQAGPSR